MSKGKQKVTKKTPEKEKEKIPVTFNSEQLKRIESLKGVLGNTKAEIVRNIVINWMLSRGDGNA